MLTKNTLNIPFTTDLGTWQVTFCFRSRFEAIHRQNHGRVRVFNGRYVIQKFPQRTSNVRYTQLLNYEKIIPRRLSIEHSLRVSDDNLCKLFPKNCEPSKKWYLNAKRRQVRIVTCAKLLLDPVMQDKVWARNNNAQSVHCAFDF